VSLSSIDSAFDAKLMAQIVSGDAKAAGKLFDRYAPMAFNLAARILKNTAEAEEVVQELFVRIWENAAQFDSSRGEVKSWMIQMTRSMSIDRLRSKTSRSKREETYAQLQETDNPKGEEIEEAKLVKAALAELPDDERSLITAAYFEGFTQAELALQFKMPLGTVKSKIRQGMLKMRRKLGGVTSV
jgi:RNA polymerase sigma-70 factor (ECF subfamily)